jgi:hypothetical protein
VPWSESAADAEAFEVHVLLLGVVSKPLADADFATRRSIYNALVHAASLSQLPPLPLKRVGNLVRYDDLLGACADVRESARSECE